MQTIEQLRRDIRPVRRLGTVSAVTGEPIGSLLIRLADKGTPLFVQPPPEGRIYCVIQTSFEAYQESILDLSARHMPPGRRIPNKDTTYVKANDFSYLVLMEQDYSYLLDGDDTLSPKLFSQAAYRGSDETDLAVVSAPQYFKDRLPNSHFHQRIKAKFACYVEEKIEHQAYAGALRLMSARISAEELLVSRTALLDLLGPEEKSNKRYPAELEEHLQPWKSDVLQALNKTAYDLYSHNNNTEGTDEKLSSTSIQEAISNPIPPKKANGKKLSQTTISLCTTLLRPKNNKPHIRQFLGHQTIDRYPFYFSLKLIYINEKCKEYHDNYLAGEEIPKYKQNFEGNLTKDKILTLDLCNRLASEIVPIYGEIIPPKK